MRTEQLLPCPHCGGTACLNTKYSWKIKGWIVFAKCDVCGAQGKVYLSPDDPEEEDWNNRPCRDAAAAWNMRTGDRAQEDLANE